MILRDFMLVGRISTSFTQRGSFSGMSDIGRYQTSWCSAGIVYSEDFTTRSGLPNPSRTACHSLSVTSGLAGGRSFGSPCGDPPSTQRTMVSTCSSVSDKSFLNFWTPTLRSMCQGGICRVATRSLIERAHGRASWYVMSDMGATSLENVDFAGVSAASAGAANERHALTANATRTLEPRGNDPAVMNASC